jgi:peptidoglycan/xylan/chitin deacetylase (PgdA/CDA1 family)
LSISEALQLPVSAPAAEPSAPTEPAPAEAIPPTAPPPPAPTVALAPTPDGTVRTARVPILMYHYLSEPPPGADRVRVDLSVTPGQFAAHLDAMQQAGYTPISLYSLLAHLTEGAPLPEKPVILTFDDGYRDNYENAFPLLKARGMTATFFVVTDFVDSQLPEYVTWDMVREMYAGGMSIESHGRNHVSLANKDRDYLIWQALGSLETIQHELGVRPYFVSYPAGDFDPLTIEVFQSANYWAGLTTAQGATHQSDDLFRLQRVRIRNSTTAGELLRLLALDW